MMFGGAKGDRIPGLIAASDALSRRCWFHYQRHPEAIKNFPKKTTCNPFYGFRRDDVIRLYAAWPSVRRHRPGARPVEERSAVRYRSSRKAHQDTRGSGVGHARRGGLRGGSEAPSRARSSSRKRGTAYRLHPSIQEVLFCIVEKAHSGRVAALIGMCFNQLFPRLLLLLPLD